MSSRARRTDSEYCEIDSSLVKCGPGKRRGGEVLVFENNYYPRIKRRQERAVVRKGPKLFYDIFRCSGRGEKKFSPKANVCNVKIRRVCDVNPPTYELSVDIRHTCQPSKKPKKKPPVQTTIEEEEEEEEDYNSISTHLSGQPISSSNQNLNNGNQISIRPPPVSRSTNSSNNNISPPLLVNSTFEMKVYPGIVTKGIKPGFVFLTCEVGTTDHCPYGTNVRLSDRNNSPPELYHKIHHSDWGTGRDRNSMFVSIIFQKETTKLRGLIDLSLTMWIPNGYSSIKTLTKPEAFDFQEEDYVRPSTEKRRKRSRTPLSYPKMPHRSEIIAVVPNRGPVRSSIICEIFACLSEYDHMNRLLSELSVFFIADSKNNFVMERPEYINIRRIDEVPQSRKETLRERLGTYDFMNSTFVLNVYTPRFENPGFADIRIGSERTSVTKKRAYEYFDPNESNKSSSSSVQLEEAVKPAVNWKYDENDLVSPSPDRHTSPDPVFGHNQETDWDGDDFNFVGIFETPPIHYAIAQGKIEVVKFFLTLFSRDAILNQRDLMGYSSLDVAKYFGQMEIIRLLCKEKTIVENPGLKLESSVKLVDYEKIFREMEGKLKEMEDAHNKEREKSRLLEVLNSEKNEKMKSFQKNAEDGSREKLHILKQLEGIQCELENKVKLVVEKDEEIKKKSEDTNYPRNKIKELIEIVSHSLRKEKKLLEEKRLNYIGNRTSEISSGAKVYTWGYGKYGSLGHGNENNEIVPKLVDKLTPFEITKMFCGCDCCSALLSNGDLLSWGHNFKRKLGHEENDRKILSPSKLVELPQNRKIIQVSHGYFYTLFLDDSGDIWGCGDNEDGYLSGKKSSESFYIPIKIDISNSPKITKIITGWNHFGCICSSGILYTWGDGFRGQLGRGNESYVLKPKIVEFFGNIRIKDVSMGYFHTLVLSEDGKLYSFGYGIYGQLGWKPKNESDSSTPRLINYFDENNIIITNISAGYFHSGALDSDGNCYIWGRGDSGQIGNGKFELCNFIPFRFTQFINSSSEVIKLDIPNRHKFVSLDCGKLGSHNICILEEKTEQNGKKTHVLIWGCGDYGRLGVNNSKNVNIPTVIPFFENKFVKGVFGGGGISAAIL